MQSSTSRVVLPSQLPMKRSSLRAVERGTTGAQAEELQGGTGEAGRVLRDVVTSGLGEIKMTESMSMANEVTQGVRACDMTTPGAGEIRITKSVTTMMSEVTRGAGVLVTEMLEIRGAGVLVTEMLETPAGVAKASYLEHGVGVATANDAQEPEEIGAGVAEASYLVHGTSVATVNGVQVRRAKAAQ